MRMHIMNSFDYLYSAQQLARRTFERKEIRVIGTVSGICIIGYILLQKILCLPVLLEPIRTLYLENTVFQDCFGIVLTILCLLIPFLTGGAYLKKRTGAETAPLGKPLNGTAAFLLILVGLFFCVAGDYLSSWVVVFFKLVGFDISLPDTPVAEGLFARITYIVYVALAAPLCEEIAIRGAVMQPLRRYGDVFAIVTSSVVFGILHCNLVQAPFAFVAGLGMGYAVCITGSLWPSIIIHSVNNLFAALALFAQNDMAPERFATFYNIVNFSFIAAGILGAIGFVLMKSRARLRRAETFSGAGSKAAAFFINVPMIIALLLMAYFTSMFIKRS